MMLLERWAVAVTVGMCLLSTAGAPGQSPASPSGQNAQQDQTQDKNKPDTDDAEPAEFHPPAQIGQPAEPSPAAEAHPSTAPNPSPPPAPVESPAPRSQPTQPVAVKPAVPDPPLSSDPVERQFQIDAAHLLQLTEDLKAELDKAGTNTLSVAALRKADEVQKLAKELKERMKDRGQVVQGKP